MTAAFSQSEWLRSLERFAARIRSGSMEPVDVRITLVNRREAPETGYGVVRLAVLLYWVARSALRGPAGYFVRVDESGAGCKEFPVAKDDFEVLRRARMELCRIYVAEDGAYTNMALELSDGKLILPIGPTLSCWPK